MPALMKTIVLALLPFASARIGSLTVTVTTATATTTKNDDATSMMRSMRSQGRFLTMAEAACTDEALAHATDLCVSLCGGDQAGPLAASFTEACVYDVCRMGPQFAVSACSGAGQTQTTLDPAAIAHATTLLGPGCCKNERQILENTPSLTKAECAIQCLSNRNCDAFAISGCSGSSDETCGGYCHLYAMKPEEEVSFGACFEGAQNGNTFCYSVQ